MILIGLAVAVVALVAVLALLVVGGTALLRGDADDERMLGDTAPIVLLAAAFVGVVAIALVAVAVVGVRG
jgi:hypothetical protein